jgi:RNA ligase
MKLDLNILEQYVNEGWLEVNNHPSLPLSIYNYSRETQFNEKWDDITLMCRGLILDKEGNVIARGFNKFFNLEEHSPEEIPNESFEVFEKMDGSLIIGFVYNGEFHTATRGSFTSEQSIDARKIVDEMKVSDIFKEGYSYLFEYIAPNNRIVVDYGDWRELVVLTIIDNKTNEEAKYPELISMACEGFRVVDRYLGIEDYTQLKSKIEGNKEGYVIRFKSGFRVKIKGEEYVRLHRLITNFSNVDIWELLKDGKSLNEFLDNVPDEFDVWVRSWIDKLKQEYEDIEAEADFMYNRYIDRFMTRKEIAEIVLKKPQYLHAILFKMVDEKDYSHLIWKLIKPEYSKPFWNRKFDN